MNRYIKKKNIESKVVSPLQLYVHDNQQEKIFGIIIDNALLFHSHIKEVCEKAFQRLAALSR